MAYRLTVFNPGIVNKIQEHAATFVSCHQADRQGISLKQNDVLSQLAAIDLQLACRGFQVLPCAFILFHNIFEVFSKNGRHNREFDIPANLLE